MTDRPSVVMAWKRAFLSPSGPKPTTRLVLAAMAMRMRRDGGGCFIGARGLAKLTGLDKSTAAEHRELAAQSGWLIPPPSKHAPKAEWRPAIPRRRRLSGEGGQSGENQLSGSGGRTVRNEPLDCPDLPDELSGKAGHISFLSPSYLPINSSDANSVEEVERRKRCIRDWAQRPGMQSVYQNARMASRAVPEHWRFAGYEAYLEEVWRETEAA